MLFQKFELFADDVPITYLKTLLQTIVDKSSALPKPPDEDHVIVVFPPAIVCGTAEGIASVTALRIVKNSNFYIPVFLMCSHLNKLERKLYQPMTGLDH